MPAQSHEGAAQSQSPPHNVAVATDAQTSHPSQAGDTPRASTSLRALLESTEPASLPTPGARVGHYLLTRQIGRGGMGAVFEAMQDQPRRLVAVKLMRYGPESPAGLRRFEFESQTLARLRHPGIAQVYEAGTHEENGRLI